MRNSRSLWRWAAGMLAGWFLLAWPAYGMDPGRAMSQYVHDKWGAEQGFPRGPVYAISQGPDGYLWIGTGAGLVRFDGWNFRVIKDDSRAFTIGSVLGLTSDDQGCLWAWLQDRTMVRYCHGVFDRPVPQVAWYMDIEAMGRTNQGGMLVWSAEQGAFGFQNGAFRRLASPLGLPRSPVISLAQARNGEVYMGTRDAGLFRYAEGKNRSIRQGLPDLKVNCLLEGAPQELWAGTDRGVVVWNGKEFTTAGLPESLNQFQALAMVRDRDGNIWVGTDSRGLLRLNTSGVATLLQDDNVPSEAVTALFEDREGSLWIGHANGIERLRDSAFVTYSLPEGWPAEGGSPVFVDSEDRTWFAPLSGGLWWVKGSRHGRVINDGLDRDVVYSLAGGNGELWIGRQRGGLTRLRDRAGSFEAKTYRNADGLAQDSVYSVYRSRDGTIWAGTLSAGVSVRRDGRFTNYTFEDGLASNTVAAMLESSDGTMWFATPSGLSSLTGGRWRSYGIADGLPSQNVNCLLEDSKGVLWVGTAFGVAFHGPNGFETPGEVPVVLRSQIFGFAEDRYGWLWIATSNRVTRVNREKLIRGSLGEGDIREYGLADGLRGMEGVKRNQSVVADPFGRIWFSLNRGISVVEPVRLTRNSAPAIAQVEIISADGKEIPMGSTVHVPGGRRRITLAFTGLSLSIPDRVRYRYRLDGFDHEWSDVSGGREAVYTNLGPGPYRFRLTASNPDGVWNSREASLAFAVDPTFWQTWWFRAGVVLACAGIIMAIYRIRTLQLTKRLNLRFEERLAERTRIAQELHDTLLQGFLSASMQVHVATDSLPEDLKAKATLTRALGLMRQVIEEGRNAVRGLRSSSSVSLDLEHAFSRIQQEVGPQEGGKETGFRVIVEGQQRPLHPLLRDEVYRIGREALINAFRHARANHVEIELKYSPSQFRVVVRDDGRGIDAEILNSGREGHWGLSGMRERAEEIGARLRLFSSAAAGTEVELSVPAHVAFEGHSRGGLRRFVLPNGILNGVRRSEAEKGRKK